MEGEEEITQTKDQQTIYKKIKLTELHLRTLNPKYAIWQDTDPLPKILDMWLELYGTNGERKVDFKLSMLLVKNWNKILQYPLESVTPENTTHNKISKLTEKENNSIYNLFNLLSLDDKKIDIFFFEHPIPKYEDMTLLEFKGGGTTKPEIEFHFKRTIGLRALIIGHCINHMLKYFRAKFGKSYPILAKFILKNRSHIELDLSGEGRFTEGFIDELIIEHRRYLSIMARNMRRIKEKETKGKGEEIEEKALNELRIIMIENASRIVHLESSLFEIISLLYKYLGPQEKFMALMEFR